MKTTKTITFDPAVYKLVPIEPTEEMLREGRYSSDLPSSSDISFRDVYQSMHAAMPDDMPGVVVHSGEPCGWRKFKTDECGENYTAYSDDEPKVMGRWEPVFDHPPAQPDTAIKPFHAPGAWFPVDVLGSPMRECAPGEWEGARWPSEQPDTAALQAQIAELERIEFVAVPLGQSKVFIEQENRIAELEAQLAAQQSEIKILRDALEVIRVAGEGDGWTAHQALSAARHVEQIAAQTEQEPFAWACWTDGTPMEAKYVASLLSYEPLAYPQRIKLYAATVSAPANSIDIVQAALDAADSAMVQAAIGWHGGDSLLALAYLRESLHTINPQTIIDAATKGRQ